MERSVLSSSCIANAYQRSPQYITWVSGDKIAWSMNAGAVGADSATEIAARQVPAEPMVFQVNPMSQYISDMSEIVYHGQPWHVYELRDGRLGAPAVPCGHAHRLYQVRHTEYNYLAFLIRLAQGLPVITSDCSLLNCF